MRESYLNQVLKQKINRVSEIEVHLFEYCNLNCSFCGQDHNSKVGFESIVAKSFDVINFIKTSPLDDHIINVMGGEIFNDLIPDKLFEDYYKFADGIIDYCRKNNQAVKINFVTNLVFKKTERVLELLGRLNCEFPVNLSTSYDFEGRGFAGVVNSIFAQNLYRFQDFIYTIGFVLTAPSIHNLLTKKDKFLEKIYEDFTLYFDYYVPEERNSDILMPSDQQLYDAFIFTAQNYPNIYPIRDWLKNEKNKMTCFSLNKVTILPDGKQVTCRYLEYEEGQFKNPVEYKSNENIIESYIEENKCLSCSWYERCSFRCFVQADWVKRERMEGCLYAKFYETMLVS
jgi:radical SAM protein with 4Fe4S-binding SPASM domain